MIEVHLSTHTPARWIGVDLNTTGHAAVAAEPDSGKILKLGKNVHYVRSNSIKNCTKLYKEGKLWKLKKIKSRERKAFKAAVSKISRQIVSFAESLGSGIKFEKLFSSRYAHSHDAGGFIEFSFGNGSFLSLQRLVEKLAERRGIPVLYVNPAYTSKRCSRCGSIGRRSRKRFECPHCGFVAHADVNAAFNIALTAHRPAVQTLCGEEREELVRLTKKEMRRRAREEIFIPHPGVMGGMVQNPCENLLAVLE
ncbi:zinc ribbon domain-containing protein [Methanoregula sp.]|uniref:zinc ribbon domain-containing protein n=1 Tax=Methanoregula sp. TaxID=2052170 RepID=UPI002B56437C|nr:zinc ribbon domain-containing protein [Methanoregula sp.]HVP97371.1 zinc ribbon domain-containing protein [Methanoregula sp.]